MKLVEAGLGLAASVAGVREGPERMPRDVGCDHRQVYASVAGLRRNDEFCGKKWGCD